MKTQLEKLEEQRNDLVKYSQLEGQVAWLTAVQYSRKVSELRERLNSTKKQEEEMQRKLEEVRKRKEEFESRIATVAADREKFISEVVQAVEKDDAPERREGVDQDQAGAAHR